ncbi:bifunctional diguanylate cyclase/phosphodiesterase [Zhongshania aquimaris]|uniref:EAL and GGDEF domain-containing protein n=1 Tax=Zhongshania aquimaris TaxID=2857107 RepID=A0ABS6VR40_9GAMM|nr:bifunctional diguanylate cyclase/phosphodiesterase [Zhongshania aquimaris]MBW2940166.1 EAL and GGDEF domain-containing protein [Zhongshania aquimaris]
MHALSADNSLNIQSIIYRRDIVSVYQAIVDTTDMSILAYEALCRGPAGPMQSPLQLFEHAQHCEMMTDLEFLCWNIACSAFDAGAEQRLFLNIHPSTLLDPRCQSELMRSIQANPKLSPSNIVLELCERQAIADFDAFRAVLAPYRDAGFGIAIDDLGAAYCGLQRWLELKPDYIKIDRHFAQDIHRDAYKAQFMQGLLALAATTNAKIIVEGIELREEAEALHNMGIRLMQGYYFHRPGTAIGNTVTRNGFHSSTKSERAVKPATGTISTLISPSQAFDINTRLDRVIDLFHNNTHLNAIPLIDESGSAMGMITRHQALDVYTREFGRELNSRKPVKHFMDSAPLIVDASTSLEAASYKITNSDREDLIQEFIISEQGRYLGVVKTVDLLRKITEQQILSARHANPLTLLPGNVPINDTISNLLQQHADFWVAYCDINHFKAFNDAYGYSQGDSAIKALATVIQSHCNASSDFVGHVGGDDFIIVFRSAVVEPKCERICADFEQAVLNLYDDDALREGGIISQDRKGNATFYATMTLSIGLVHPDPMLVSSAHAVSALASDAKKAAKKLAGGGVYTSRRQH